MNVLLVNGSPRVDGNTYRALCVMREAFGEEGVDCEIFQTGPGDVAGCRACYGCCDVGCCVIDDKVNEFVDLMGDADGFVFASPVYYASASGSLTSFMDRVFFSASNAGHVDYYEFKPAAGVVTARRGGCCSAYDQINRYFGINNMPVISSRYWNMLYTDEWDFERFQEDVEGVDTLRKLAYNMSYFIKCISVGREAGLRPRTGGGSGDVFTNFIRKS